jgi:hypothetical protein
MRTTILLTAFILLTSCGPGDVPELPSAVGDFKVIVVDGCEYLYRTSGHAGYLAHKGNCRQCIERERRERELHKH